MLILAALTWWYTTGWLMLATRIGGRIQGTLRFFSVGQLLGSLFAPYRQISAGRVQGPLAVQLRAWGDRQFSRVIGAIVRLILVIIGVISALTMTLSGLLLLFAWPLVPVLPFVGVWLMSNGGLPL